MKVGFRALSGGIWLSAMTYPSQLSPEGCSLASCLWCGNWADGLQAPKIQVPIMIYSSVFHCCWLADVEVVLPVVQWCL